MIVKDIIEKLNKISPESLACAWDNVGLIVGSKEKKVSKILVVVDVRDVVVDFAIDNNIDMIVSHHPMIFSGIKNVVDTDFIGNKLIKLIKNDIAVYAMHTNFDKEGSMGIEAANKLWLNNIVPLATKEDDNKGLGVLGEYSPINLKRFSFVVKDAFNIENMKVYGDMTKMVKTVAILPGSGSDFIDLAIEKGADVLITGDISHHKGLDAVEKGLLLIDVGHYGIEKIFVDFISKYLQREVESVKIIPENKDEAFNWI